MNNPVFLISVTFVASIICSLLPRKTRPFFALLISIFTLIVSYNLFRLKSASWDLFGYAGVLRIDSLAAFVLLFVSFFGVLTILYSIGFMKQKAHLGNYYAYILATIAGSIGAVLSNNMFLFISFWGFLGITLYLLIGLGGDKAKGAAK